MSQNARNRKLVSQLSKRYFRYRIKKLTNSQDFKEKATYKFKRNTTYRNDSTNDTSNNNSSVSSSNSSDSSGENPEAAIIAHNTDQSSEHDNELNCDLTNINVYEINNYVAGDINICRENKEIENDFTTSHLARWCKTLNVPITHVNMLLKDLRKHKCFKTTFPSDVRTLINTPRSTQLKIVPPGEYYHHGLINELVRVLSKSDIENIDLTLNIDSLPLSKSSGKQLWPILVSIAGVQGEIMVGAYCGNKKPDDIIKFIFGRFRQ